MMLPTADGHFAGIEIDCERQLKFHHKTQLYAHLKKKYMLPFQEQLSLHELEEANKGNRTMPKIDKDVYQRAVKIVDEAMKEGKKNIVKPKLLSASSIRQRVSVLLLMSKKPPLFFPKFGEELNKKYIVYCALLFDPSNWTRYKEGVVGMKFEDAPAYVSTAYGHKSAALETLKKYGFTGDALMTNMSTEIIRYSMSHVKLIESIEMHECAFTRTADLDKAYDGMEMSIYRLASEMYGSIPTNLIIKDMDAFLGLVAAPLKVLFHFDPFSTSYISFTFDDVFGIDFISEYNKFTVVRQQMITEEKFAAVKGKAGSGSIELDYRTWVEEHSCPQI
jgi:hypothetical protein